MCANCGFPLAQEHWTDAGARSGFERLRGRLLRAQLLAPVLAAYGLGVYDDGTGPSFTLSTRTGSHVLVGDLGELWTQAERLAGRAIDPLDQRFAADEGQPG